MTQVGKFVFYILVDTVLDHNAEHVRVAHTGPVCAEV